MRRYRPFVVLGLAAMVWLFSLAGPAAATAPQPVTIIVPTDVTGERSEDPFTATGGIVCEAGTVSNSFALFTGWQSDTHAQILIGKLFVCPEGTFEVLLRVKLHFDTGQTFGTWSVRSGTGAFAGLKGTGSLVGIPQEGDIILDMYTGAMHTH